MEQTVFFILIVVCIVCVVIAIGAIIDIMRDKVVEETVHSERRYKVTKANPFTGMGSEYYITRFVIKRRYLSGKIKFITKDVQS